MHNYHIYILSNDIPKMGDWVFDTKHNMVSELTIDNPSCLKITHTTNPSLFYIVSNGDPNPNDTTQISLPKPDHNLILLVERLYNTINLV